MSRLIVRLSLLGILTSSCTAELRVDDAPIGCESNTDCPSGFTCQTAAGRCVESVDATQAPAQIQDVAVAGTLARVGTTISVDFTTDIELLEEPVVELASSPPLRFSATRLENTSFRFESTIDSILSDGTFPVNISLVDVNGNPVDQSVDDQLVTLDFTLPGLSAFTANNGVPLKIGDALTIDFVASEPLQSARVVLADGTELVRNDAVAAPDFQFTGALGSGAAEGTLDVAIELVDVAGNDLEITRPDVYVVDLTEPTITGTPEVVEPFVRNGDVARVRFTVSEELDEPLVIVLQPVDPEADVITLPDVQIRATTITASIDITPETVSSGEYTIVLQSYTDLAGNPGVSTPLGALEVDSEPPGIVGDIEATPAFASRTPGFNTISATFLLDEDIGTDASQIRVRFGENPMSCTRSTEGELFRYSCTYSIATDAGSPEAENDSEGGVFVSVTAEDGAGNVSVGPSTAVVLDFQAPAIVGTPALSRTDFLVSASLSPGAVLISTLNDPAAPRPDVRFSFGVDEPLASDPVIGGVNPDRVELLSGASTSFTYRFEITDSDSYPDTTVDNPVVLTAEVSDRAGNTSTLSVGALHFDSTRPTLDTDELNFLRLFRSPWGTEDAAATTRLDVEAGANLEAGSTLFVLSTPDVATAPRIAVIDAVT
ncbi:MAG: hypothetical protein AAF658_07580, partial [Myxococcota bacterium]